MDMQAGAGTLAIQVHDGLAAVEETWRAAEVTLAAYAFQSFDWVRSWQDTVGAAERVRPAIVVVTDGGRTVMILPLGIARVRGVRVLSFLGGNVTDYNAPLIDPALADGLDDAGFAGLWDRVLGAVPKHDLVRLPRMPVSIDGPDGMAGPDGAAVPNPLARLSGTVSMGQAQSVRLPDSYALFQKALKTKFVADTRRRRRRMAELGAVTLSVARDPAAMQAVLDALIRLKSRRWAETKAKDWFAVPYFREFYTAMSARAPGDGRVHGSLLHVGDTVVAVHWGMVWRGRFYHLMLGWESGDWMRFATGRLITDELIEGAIAEGLHAFDFTVGDEAYKQDWVDTALPLVALERAVTPLGRAVLAADAAVAAVRARAKQVDWLRRAVRRLRGLPVEPRGEAAKDVSGG